MNRKLFFWLEKLKITPHERITVVVLLLVLLTLSGVNLLLEPVSSVDTKHYREIEKEFMRRTALLDRQQAELMKRYHPAEKVRVEAGDTLPPRLDSLKGKTGHQAPAGEEKVNINTAMLEELISLPGIGPVYGQRIIDYRNRNGPFGSADELINIKGIGEKRLERLKDLIEL